MATNTGYIPGYGSVTVPVNGTNNSIGGTLAGTLTGAPITQSTVPGSTAIQPTSLQSNISPAGVTGATPGSTVNTSAQSTTNLAGPLGAFAGLGPQLSTSAAATNAAGQQALQTGMAGLGSNIYNQQLQQEQNQTNVNEAQRGITSSPYGAGVANQADINFNSNWQNNQLARDQAGIAAAASGMAPATGLYNTSYGNNTAGYGTTPPAPAQPAPLNPADSSAFGSTGSSVPMTGSVAQATPTNAVTAPVQYQSPIGSTGTTTSGPILTQGQPATGQSIDVSGGTGTGIGGVIPQQSPVQGPALTGQTPGTYTGQPSSPTNIDSQGQMQGPALTGQTPGTYNGQVQNIDSGSPAQIINDPNATPQQVIQSIPDVPTDSSPSIYQNIMDYLGGVGQAVFGGSSDDSGD